MAAEQRWHPISPYQQTESKAFYGKIYEGLLNNFFNLSLKNTEYAYGAAVAYYFFKSRIW